MKQCPVCTSVLQVQFRMGIEIDTCPRCRGVWLDRGELDKILAFSAPAGDSSDQVPVYRPAPPPPPMATPVTGYPVAGGTPPAYSPAPGYAPPPGYAPGYGPPPAQHYQPHPKKRKSFWQELFDD